MGSWSKKLGYVIPSWNTVIEYETARMAPADTSTHYSRISHTDDSPGSLQLMTEQFPKHVELLLHAKLDAVCYGCTGASFFAGREFDKRFVGGLADKVGKPIVSMAGALVDAATHLGMSRIAVAAPYEDWLLAKLVSYLQEAGFTVTNAVGLGQQANIVHSPEMAMDLARRGWTADSDGLILSCGNFRTLEVIDSIENEIGKPVLTSNQCALWSLLYSSGWRGTIQNAGRLLKELKPDSSNPIRVERTVSESESISARERN
jgi:maleate isomerase